MRRLGVLGRADETGIAAQSLAVAQHLHPVAALVLDLSPGDRGRGQFDPARWHGALHHHGAVWVDDFPFCDEALAWLVGACDVIFAVEGPPPGRDDFPEMCAMYGVELVYHANPELWRESYRSATTRVTLPTSWHRERFPDASVLPMPVDRRRFPFTLRTEATTFLHVSAPAFHDRNGTALVLECLRFVTEPVTVIFHGLPGYAAGEEQIGNVRCVYQPCVADNRRVYPDAADVLVLPRRYGGQSLTVNEAASLGIPCLTLDLPPLNARPGVVTVPPQAPYEVGMIGGPEVVWSCQPEQLAAKIDELATQPEQVESLSSAANIWAQEHSWDTLKPLWIKTLGLDDR